MKHLVKNKEDIEQLRESGKRLAVILDALADFVKPGVTTKDIDDLAMQLITKNGDTASFKNYTPQGAPRPFPAAVCTAINDEVVHGISNENPQTLSDGDIIGIDLGVTHNNLITDSAVTIPVGTISDEIKALLSVTKQSLFQGIRAARAGNRVGDIGHAIESFVDGRYSIIEELGGHGVGYRVHEEPTIPNFGAPGTGMELTAGMVIALEPMLTMGGKKIVMCDDGYTIKTHDGSLSAHFEHTILITENDPEILTLSKHGA